MAISATANSGIETPADFIYSLLPMSLIEKFSIIIKAAIFLGS
jgi:hypothetical protein